MPNQQDPSIEHTLEQDKVSTDKITEAKDNQPPGKAEQLPGENANSFTAGNETPEIATNDGSIIETLDTVLHGTPGWTGGENFSGSNRADYYEARSNGKSDTEEEQDEIRKRNAEDI